MFITTSAFARAEAAQFIAYWPGIAFLVEDLLPVVIGRPSAVAAVIPAGDPCISSGSKRNAVGHRTLLLPLQKGAVALVQTSKRWPIPIVGIEPIGSKKRHTSAKFSQPLGATRTAGRLFGDLLGSLQDRRFVAFGTSYRFACLLSEAVSIA